MDLNTVFWLMKGVEYLIPGGKKPKGSIKLGPAQWDPMMPDDCIDICILEAK